MDLDPELRSRAAEILDKPVKAIVEESLEDGAVVGRRVQSVDVLELRERGPELPPKDLLTLAREQGLLFEPVPDYVALASAVWSSEAEISEFEEYFRSVRSHSA